MPRRIHVIRTLWSHWGAYAGIVRYLRYLPAAEFSIDDRPTHHEDETRPRPRRRAWEWMRGKVRQRGVSWYTLHDLRSEVRAARRIGFGQVDVLHYLDPEHGMQYVPPMVRRMRPTRRPRVIATFHQPPDILAQVVPRDLVTCVDHVTVVSPDQAEYFRQFLPAEFVSVILHGIDTAFFSPPPPRERSSSWTCLMVGHNLRDFDALRLVAHRLRGERGLHFEVVATHTNGLDGLPNVTVRSGVSDLELLHAYRSADVLFLPLKSATANNALLEGFACGLPTVTTDLPSLRAYAPDGEALMVRDNEPVEMAEQILALRSDEALARRLGRAARHRAEALDWTRIAPAYASVYRG